MSSPERFFWSSDAHSCVCGQLPGWLGLWVHRISQLSRLAFASCGLLSSCSLVQACRHSSGGLGRMRADWAEPPKAHTPKSLTFAALYRTKPVTRPVQIQRVDKRFHLLIEETSIRFHQISTVLSMPSTQCAIYLKPPPPLCLCLWTTPAQMPPIPRWLPP